MRAVHRLVEAVHRLFGKLTSEDIARQQRENAEVLSLEHAAASEHHAALARMYRQRVKRLESLR